MPNTLFAVGYKAYVATKIVEKRVLTMASYVMQGWYPHS